MLTCELKDYTQRPQKTSRPEEVRPDAVGRRPADVGPGGEQPGRDQARPVRLWRRPPPLPGHAHCRPLHVPRHLPAAVGL